MSFAPTKVQLEVLIKWHKDCNNWHYCTYTLYMYQHHSVNVNVTGQFQVEL